MKRFISLLLVVVMLATCGLTVCATEYAYSIGHNFGNTILFDDYEGDFTPNVKYAAKIYGMMGYDSYQSFDPTYTYLQGQNPGGQDRLGSSVVFLNGHGSSNSIVFGNKTNNEPAYRCGVHRDYDFAPSTEDYIYTGLKDRDLSNTKLISFFCCNSATTSPNLCSVAIDRGATCSIGFTNNIQSRTTDGQKWIETFHNYLYNGSTVQNAASLASISVPKNEVGNHIKIYGDRTITLTLNSTRTMNENETESLAAEFLEIIESSKDTDCPIDIDTSLITISDCKDKYFDFAMTEQGEYIDLESVIDCYSDVIDVMNEINPEFSVEDYKVFANEYAEGTGDGIINVTYFIEDIMTSYTTVFIVSAGEIRCVSHPNQFKSVNAVQKSMLNIRAKLFETSQTATQNVMTTAIENMSEDEKLVSTSTSYYYDFDTDTLYQVIHSVYELADLGVYSAHSVEVEVA